MKKTAAEKNRITGARLDYVMKLKNKRDIDLINYVLDNYDDIYVDSSMMSMYTKGTKHIPQDIVKAFSNYLEIDPGYLLGLDGFLSNCNDYYAYRSIMETKNRLENYNEQTAIYSKYLSLMGYVVKTIKTDGKKIATVGVIDKNNKSYVLPHKELMQYAKEIEKYLKVRTKQLLQKSLKEGDAND